MNLRKKLYVANVVSGTVSIIDYLIDSSGEFRYANVSEIKVGGFPNDLTVDPLSNRVYVTVTEEFSGKGFISVIDGSSNQIINNLTVSEYPESIDINPNNKMILITHPQANSITIIDGKNNSLIETIHLNTRRPWHIAINPEWGIGYISNDLASTLYLINQTTSKFLVGALYQINSTGAGSINCASRGDSDNRYSEHGNNEYVMYDLNTTISCRAEPETGFNFVNWGGSFVANGQDKVEANITLDRFGTVIANFGKIQSPLELPKEIQDTLWALMVGVIIGPIAGWLIHRTLEKIDKKRQLKYLNVYMQIIDEAYEKNQGNKDECKRILEEKSRDIMALIRGGIVSDSTFHLLKERISEYIDTKSNQP